MQRRPTSHDVARLAGVSQSTVSRALRDDPLISPATRRRVRVAADRLAYLPSRRGRSLSTRTTGQVGVVVRDLGNPFYTEAVQHLHHQLQAAGRRTVVFTDSPDDPVTLEALLDGSIDGVVLATTLLGSSLPAQVAAGGLPVVLFNRAIDADAFDVCESENRRGSREVAAALAGLGHTEVGAIFGPVQTSTGRDREAGFRDGLQAAGLRLQDSRTRRGGFTYEHGHAAFTSLMHGRRPPTAVFCGNDVVAVGALNAARALGVAVPGRVTVFGFDDIAMAGWDVFRLSTVLQDLEALAATAVRLVVERIADPGLPGRWVTVPTELVLRATHGAPPLARAGTAGQPRGGASTSAS